MPSKVRIYEARLYLQSTAMAVKFLRRVTREVELEAKANALTGSYATGRLSRSIGSNGPFILGTSVYSNVSTGVSYARAVEHGARIHAIFPKRAPHVYRFGRTGPPMLKFFWRRAGRVAYFPQIPGSPGTIGVSHPGQRGKGYMLRALRSAAIRHRMRIIVLEI